MARLGGQGGRRKGIEVELRIEGDKVGTGGMAENKRLPHRGVGGTSIMCYMCFA